MTMGEIEISMNETQTIVSQISRPFVTTLRNHVCLKHSIKSSFIASLPEKKK